MNSVKHQPSNKYQSSSAINISGTPKTAFNKSPESPFSITIIDWVTLNYTPGKITTPKCVGSLFENQEHALSKARTRRRPSAGRCSCLRSARMV